MGGEELRGEEEAGGGVEGAEEVRPPGRRRRDQAQQALAAATDPGLSIFWTISNLDQLTLVTINGRS